MNFLVTLLRSVKFNFTDEYELQDGIAHVLQENGISFVREHNLTNQDKIDFLVGDVGIEVKVAGSATMVSRQILRYLRSSDLNSIIVVTARVNHQLPEELDGKTITVVYVGGL